MKPPIGDPRETRPPGVPEIRAERASDREAIATVMAIAFESSAHALLVQEIRASPNFVPELSLVAEIDDRIVGHVMISHVGLHDGQRELKIASLSPLAVLPEFERRGIGSMLVREATARARRRGEPVVVVEGDPRFYGRFGFEPASRLGIEITLPSWAPPDAAQVLRLDGHTRAIRGRVVYPPAFDVVSDR